MKNVMAQPIYISFVKWRMKRAPFNLYLGMFVPSILAFFFVYSNAVEQRAVEGMVWMLTACLALILFPVMSMRLKDAGRSAFWPLPILFSLCYLGFQILGELASVSGAPRGGADPQPNTWARMEDELVFATLLALLLLTLFCTFAASVNHQNPTEVPS